MIRALTGSLRARLLWFLLAAIVLAAGAQAVVAYRTVLKEADDIFDYHMQQMALSLRAGLPPSAAVGGIGSGEQNFEFVVQVWTADGVRIFESAEQAALPQLAVLGFADVRARGTTYRVFSMQTSGLVIQVAQDMAARRNMAGALALRTIAPVALMAPLLMLIVWWVVSLSLAPVARVRTQVASRQADDLSAVSEEGLPDEVRPLVQELNLLFDRVRHAFDAQKHFVADAAHELRSPLAALEAAGAGPAARARCRGARRGREPAGRRASTAPRGWSSRCSHWRGTRPAWPRAQSPNRSTLPKPRGWPFRTRSRRRSHGVSTSASRMRTTPPW